MSNVAHPPTPPNSGVASVQQRWPAIHVVLETIAHFCKDPVAHRATAPSATGVRCLYRRVGEAPANCALGRYLRPDNYEGVWNCSGSASTLFWDWGMDILLPQVRHLPIFFWQELQTLHDEDMLWDDVGLTPAGLSFAARMTELAHRIDTQQRLED